MQNVPSLLRLAEYKALSGISLSGRVLDLGGDKRSEYTQLFKGHFTVTTVNLNEKAEPDLVHDLENPLPLGTASHDHVLLINVLEHVYEYRPLLREAVRILKPQGNMILVVPFLFPVHPSPQDYHRFTATTLEKELLTIGLHHVEITPLGGGVFSARYVLLDRLLPKPLRVISFYTWRYVAEALDRLAIALARMAHKKYDPHDYALGYCATGIKQ
jgi:SAM-dependent methyltransferase